jgi:predicted metal-dependent phosphoesterase TrpH
VGRLLIVELHCHSIYSKDSLNTIDGLLKRMDRLKIDRLAITDHNTIRGALHAHKIASDRFIVGEEIKTQKGEILAFFLQEEVPRGLTPVETIARLRQQDAFISVSHPFDLQRSGWLLPDLIEITPLVDAIEIFNARCLEARINDMAIQYALKNNLSGTVGSDAHTLPEVGRAVLKLPDFSDAEGLRQVIGQAKQYTRLSSFWVHFGSTYARFYKQAFGIRPEREQ